MVREGHCKQILLACVGSAHSVWNILGLPQLKAACTSWVYTAQAPRCSAGALSKVAPVFRALPRSKLLRFSGVPQGHRLGWACVLYPSQVLAAQVTRCFASTLSQVGCTSYSPPRSQPLSFSGVQQELNPRCAVCLPWGLISGWDTPGRCEPSRIPGRCD